MSFQKRSMIKNLFITWTANDDGAAVNVTEHHISSTHAQN